MRKKWQKESGSYCLFKLNICINKAGFSGPAFIYTFNILFRNAISNSLRSWVVVPPQRK